MKYAACLLVAFVCSAAFASEPGQPLDCSDWVFLEPGHTCERIPNLDPVFLTKGAGVVADNAGRLLTMLTYPTAVPAQTWYGNGAGYIRIQAFDGSGLVTVGFVEDRMGPNGLRDHIRPARPDCRDDGWQSTYFCSPGFALAFDAVNGRLLIPVEVFCGDTWSASCPAYGSAVELIAIGGFTSIYEVRQTFDPPTSSLGFRIPPMPEGMAAADHFDTYWGPLTKPLDFTAAHPLQCHYPANPPAVGDYLTVPDTVPTPAPGQGVFYITSATYQGQTRYGRNTTNGHLTGRDPSLLPACTLP